MLIGDHIIIMYRKLKVISSHIIIVYWEVNVICRQHTYIVSRGKCNLETT